MSTERPAAFETRAIHFAQEPDPATGAVVVPVYATSAFIQDTVDTDRGYTYSRAGNPTRAALQRCLANLEGARHGFCFASGLAAEDAVLRLLRPGDHLLVPRDFYGGTYRLLARLWEPMGVTFTPVDQTDVEAVAGAFGDATRMLWIESPSNPRLDVVDIEALCALARERGVTSVVDNTVASPYLQQPLALGADVVVHSTTKYVGGHSDLLGGFAATSDDGLAASLALTQHAAGAVPSAFDCFLLLRGVKTLAVRMDRHCVNAAAVAGFLDAHPAVSSVLYPGLPSNPGHDLARRQMRGFGGMLSFTLHGGAEAAKEVCAATRVFALGGSLGGVESLISYPPSMSHSSVEGTDLAADPALVRLSVGIEAADDLIDDLAAALDAVG